MKRESGIALIILILIIAVIGAVLFVGIKYISQYMNNEQKEDIKATMLTIQGAITNIQNKHIVDEENNQLVGTKVNLETNETEYQISEELMKAITTVENSELYFLSNEDLNNIGVKKVDVNNQNFFIVDYNSQEVFYSLGIDGKYKLSEM